MQTGERIERTDVVIVGAGFTGLSAAQALKDTGLHVLILEARDRVGGRVESQVNVLGERIDTGGQSICEDMPQVMALVRQHGKTLVEAHLHGDFTVQPPMSEADAERTYTRSMALRKRMLAIPPDDPAIAGLTVAAWLDRQPDSSDAKAAFHSMIEGLWCVSIDELPLWYLISNDSRVTNEVPESQYWVAETMHALADDLAAPLTAQLRLATPVTRIERGPTGLRVLASNAEGQAVTVEARAALVAVPPVMASRLDHSPALPTPLTRALAAWRSGAVIKILLRYDRAFWRDRGLSGMVMWREPHGLFAFDCSADERHAKLVFFASGPRALQWRKAGADFVRTEALASLAAALGPDAATPLDVTIRDWTDDRWSGGAYSDLIMDMNATDAEDVLRAGAPPLFFASSELSPSYPGYIEGAIVAGREGAAEVAALLAHSPSATSASGS